MKLDNGLIAPTVNLNGTDGKELVDSYVNVIAKLQTAASTLRLCMPHGRDYQTTEPNELNEAIRQHGRWMEHLRSVIQDMTDVAISIQKQHNRKEG